MSGDGHAGSGENRDRQENDDSACGSVMATYEACVSQIQQLLAESAAKGEVVGENVDLIDEFGLASLDVMELIEQLEDIFDVSFPINELGDVRTISDLAHRLQKLT